MSKKVLIAICPEMLEQIDFIAQCEHRNRSDLFREALRDYMLKFARLRQEISLGMNTVEKEIVAMKEHGISPSPNSLTMRKLELAQEAKKQISQQQHQSSISPLSQAGLR
jgi:predicted transcriptional regulator